MKLWDDSDDEEEEEERKRAWRSGGALHQAPILSDLTNRGRGGKVFRQYFESFLKMWMEPVE